MILGWRKLGERKSRCNIGQWSGRHRTGDISLQQIEKTHSKDGLGRFQHWGKTLNPGVKRPFSRGVLFCRDES